MGIRFNDEFVAKIITTVLETESAKNGPEYFISVPELAKRLGGPSVDSVEAAVRKMDTVSVVTAEKATEANATIGVGFELTKRKGKDAGHYPGVRLMSEGEVLVRNARNARRLRAAKAIEANLEIFGVDVSVRFDDEGRATVTLDSLGGGKDGGGRSALDSILAALE